MDFFEISSAKMAESWNSLKILMKSLFSFVKISGSKVLLHFPSVLEESSVVPEQASISWNLSFIELRNFEFKHASNSI